MSFISILRGFGVELLHSDINQSLFRVNIFNNETQLYFENGNAKKHDFLELRTRRGVCHGELDSLEDKEVVKPV